MSTEEVKGVRLTKKGLPDKRYLSSKANAAKAREAKLKKLAQKREMMDSIAEDDTIEEEDNVMQFSPTGSENELSDSSNDEESEDEQIRELREQLAARVKTKNSNSKSLRKKVAPQEVKSEPKAPTLSYDELAETVAKTVTKTLKISAEEKKAIAKAKREAVRKAKAEGTYVPKPRGRPRKGEQTSPNPSITKTDKAVAEYVEQVGGEPDSSSTGLREKKVVVKSVEKPSGTFISW